MPARKVVNNFFVVDDNGDIEGFQRTKDNRVARLARLEKNDGTEADSSVVVVSSTSPSDSDGRPNGTIYIQTA